MNPSGPLPVGVVDISATDAGAGVERLAARLFYPCSRSWSFPCTWISHINYARGYVGYLFKFVTQKTWRTELAKAALTSAACVLGNSRLLPVYYNAPVAPLKATAADGDAGLLPVVIFSHGLAGTRNTYSSICIELASRGYMVMALEHSDGSASVARLPRLPSSTSLPPTATATCAAPSSPEVVAASRKPSCARSSNPVYGRDVGNGISSSGSNGSSSGGSSGSTRGGSSNSGGGNGSEWCFYGGLGDKPEQLRKTRHRVAEVAAAYELLRRLHEGRAGSPESASNSTDTTNNTTTDKTTNASSSSSTYPAWCELPPGLASTLVGRLDLGRVAVVGHSYGGATAAAAVAELPFLRAAVSLDPWWDCYDPLWPVLSTWTNPHAPPLLVVGSEDWNSPNSEGKLKCGGPNRDRVLAAAAASGGGAVMVVPRGSTHVNFDDIMLLYGKSLSAVLRILGLRSSLEPRRAHHINMWCILHFLATHMLPPPSPVDPTTPNDLSSTHDGGGPTSDKDVAMPVRHESLQPYKDAVGQWSAELVVFPRGGGGAPGDAVAYE